MISVITPALVKDEHTYQWLHECIASVDKQAGTFEHIVVNDHSPVNLDALKERWPKVRWLEAEMKGVSAARNQAAEAARYDLLLPLDADDKLSTDALKLFLEAWQDRGKAGIIYSDVVMFGEDYAQVYLAAEYNFWTLLKATFMTVGCLHRKADWERVGGWRLDMQQGLEDWEYWLALGEMGVCGKHYGEPLYWYRRHPRGRLQWLRSNTELWDKAYLAMRELHRDTFNGRVSDMCCGGSKRPAGARRPLHGGVPRAAAVARPKPGKDAVLVAYYGPRKGDFMITGGVTRTKYRVPGPGQIVELAKSPQQGIHPADLKWFLSVDQGRAFKAIEQKKEPEAAPAPAPAPAPKAVRVREYKPEVMEEVELAPELRSVSGPISVGQEIHIPEKKERYIGPIPDIQSMTVAEIKDMGIDPTTAAELLAQEWTGKNRKTVIAFLEGLA